MSEVDWSKAPEWSDRLMESPVSGKKCWANDVRYRYSCSGVGFLGSPPSNFKVVSTRITDKWQEGEKRMNNIAQNGNDGHYEEVQDFTKQPRYKDENGLDWIDEFAANNSIEDFRAAMRFTIGKYERRLGKKDEFSKELYKISDYYARWSQVEKELQNE